MQPDQLELKIAIKNWEHEFREKNGRNPSKDDIKANQDIALKYKVYRKLKSKPIPETPTKSKEGKLQIQLATPVKTSPLKVEELGPTPQLNGKVLSIFDVITSPEETPVKSAPELEFDVTETPSRKLDFADIFGDSEEEYSDVSDYVGSQNEVQVPSSQFEFKTPTKNKVVHLLETPAYLKTSQPQLMTASPSPLASQRMKKPLSVMISELKDIEYDLKYGDYDIDELIPKLKEEQEGRDNLEEEDNEDNEADQRGGRKKKPTQKRSTRRVKMKARASKDVDSGPVSDWKAKIADLETVKQSELTDGTDDEQWSEEEKPYVRQKIDPNAKAPIRRNFQKYKIQKKKLFFGKRSRR